MKEDEGALRAEDLPRGVDLAKGEIGALAAWSIDLRWPDRPSALCEKEAMVLLLSSLMSADAGDRGEAFVTCTLWRGLMKSAPSGKLQQRSDTNNL